MGLTWDQLDKQSFDGGHAVSPPASPAHSDRGSLTKPLSPRGSDHSPMADGILDLLEFVGTVILAAPPALLGVLLVSSGDLLGGAAMLAVAAGMVLFEEYVLSARDLVRRQAGRVLGSRKDEK